eukprot:COSAG01_NODE_10593_length_2125_cov_1.835143_2_plen_191_part_00
MTIFKPQAILALANRLKAGEIGLFPCDTIWGIIGLLNQENIQKIRRLKGKNNQASMLTLIPDLSYLDQLCQPLTQAQMRTIQQDWPGPSTFIFAGHSAQYPMPSPDQSIGIRLPEYLPLNLLLDHVKAPLLSSSANLNGQPPIKHAHELPDVLKSQLDFCYDEIGPASTHPSAVVDLRSDPPVVLRERAQ